jgi:hypothetical protein
MSNAKPGNPQIDIDTRNAVKNAVTVLRKNARNLDSKTLSDIESFLHNGLSTATKYRGVRQTQRTAVVGGGRRKTTATKTTATKTPVVRTTPARASRTPKSALNPPTLRIR